MHPEVAVIGLGTVGMPTAALLVAGGSRVTGVDIDPVRLASLEGDASEISETSLRDLWFDARASGRLGISDRVPSLAAYIVCVPTPVDDDGKPDLGPLAASLRGIGAAMKPRALVMVESTLPPGGSRLAVPILEEACRGLAGDTFLYAYVPERVLPGDVVREIRENARIVGTRDERARVAAEALLRIYVKGEIRHTDPETAEMVKLAENSYRMVNVGFANEIAGLCESAGVDGREVIRLANLHPRVRILDPGPGVAGPCLPKDPRLLAHGREGDSRLILAALEANERARERLFSALQAALRLAGRTIRGARVLVLGVAYKGGIADTTGSPGLWLARRIRDEGGEPVLCDPRSSLPGERVLKDAYEGADGCVAAVVCTEHPEYRSLDLERLRRAMADRPALVDGRGVVPDAPGFVFRTPVRPAR